jgi:hypothetical protein
MDFFATKGEIMKFELFFNCDNAAFSGLDEHNAETAATEIVRILREVASRIESGDTANAYRDVRDFNGNIVGKVKLHE